MRPDSAFELTITALSPLHIASGGQLSEDYDFIANAEQHVVYVVNDEAALLLAEQKLDRRREGIKKRITDFSAKPARQQTEAEERKLRDDAADEKRLREKLFRDLTPGDLVSEKVRLLRLNDLRENPEIDGQRLVRYMLRGDLGNSHLINEQIKDVFGRAYIPGSSLKGAIRTALAWQLFAERGLRVERPWGNEAKKADDRYEEQLFIAGGDGNAVNRDVLRGLRVSDSTPLEGDLILAPLRIQRKGRQGGPTFDVLNVEAVPAESQFRAMLHIDEFLLTSELVREKLPDFQRKGAALRAFVSACRARGEQLISNELAFFQERGPAQLVRFYDVLRTQARALGENSFMLQLGWGTGWHSKTLDDRLSADENVFAAIVNDYRLQPQRQGGFAPGDLFPATRKLALRGEQPMAALGWVRVDVQEVTR